MKELRMKEQKKEFEGTQEWTERGIEGRTKEGIEREGKEERVLTGNPLSSLFANGGVCSY